MDVPKDKEDLYGLRYSEFVVPLVKSVQEQQQEIAALKEEIKELKETMAKLINGQSVATNNNNTMVTPSGAYMLQNAPNPFDRTTIIRFHLPQGIGAAKVVITNAKGQMLKSIAVNGSGAGQITLDGGTLAAGSYTYSLWVEGRKVDAKQMIIQK